MKKKHSIAAIIIAGALLGGCSQPVEPSNPEATPATTATPEVQATPEVEEKASYSGPAAQFSEADKALAEELLGGWNENGYFEHASTMKKENGRGYLYLAANAEEPDKRAGALVAIKKVYVDYDNDKKLLVDDDYRATVYENIDHSDKAVQRAALQAAYPVVRGDNPNLEFVQVLLGIANNHPEAAGRYEAGRALSALSGKAREANPEVAKLFVKLSKDEDFVAASAIDWTYDTFQDDEALRNEALNNLLELTKHEHPAVRGRAIDKFASLSKDQDKIVEEAGKLLDDADPFVVAEALKALGSTRNEEVVPLIAKHLDDSRENRLQLKFQDLSGKDTQLNLGGLSGRTVADAATKALDKATDGRPDKGFEAARVSPGKSAQEDIAKNVAAAKEWLAQDGKN